MDKFFPVGGEYNYYGDESCHLLKDNNKFMALGAVCCPKNMREKLTSEIQNIKAKHGLSKSFEIKCTKVSVGALDFYKEIVLWFLNCDFLKYRVVLINKEIVDNRAYHQTHNDFYYKMYFILFRYFLYSSLNYIYLDYKDSQSHKRCTKLEDVLNNDNLRTKKKIYVSQINSTESCLIQLTDLLTGLVCYNANGKTTNPAKLELIKTLTTVLGYNLFMTTPPADDVKFDILNWRPKK